MKWVTRERVHVDRVACPWLIKRFIDPEAEFKFVPWPGTELKPEDGIPFDIPGVELGHHDNKCSFETIIEKYDLKDDLALLELAKIVHSADIAADRDKMPEATGLEAIASGAMYIVKDDYEALEKEFFIYDALYAYCQLKLLREQYKEQLEKMSRKERFEFLKARIKKIG
ncbi:chromate resistance protein [Candidatus Bathyarchaeota archaeon]|nr:MAG: chromate resistance protein [Candidatus Bathyarchaeota archaeon]